MKTTKNNDEYELLQYHTVPTVSRLSVHFDEALTVITVSSYCTAVAVQETAANWWLGMKSVHYDYQDEVKKATVRNLMELTEKFRQYCWATHPITDQ